MHGIPDEPRLARLPDQPCHLPIRNNLPTRHPPNRLIHPVIKFAHASPSDHAMRPSRPFLHNYRRCLHLASAHFLRLSRAKASCVIPSHARRRRPEQGKPGANPARSRHCDATAKLPPSQNTCQEACMRKRRLSANAPSTEALLRSKATPSDHCRRQIFAVCLLREREPNPARPRAKVHVGKGKEKKDSESNNCANASNARAKSDRAAHGARPLHGADPPTQLGQKKRGRRVIPSRRKPPSSLPLPSPS